MTRPGRRTSRAVVVAAASVVASLFGVLAAPAPAASAATNLPCTPRLLSVPFKLFGDLNSYFGVPGGTFEHGTSGWSMFLAGVTAGSEPWQVVADTNNSSLKLYPGGNATAPTMCVSTAEDSMRFFYKAPGMPFSGLKVSIHVVSGLGLNTFDGTYEVLSGNKAGWAVSPRIPLPDIRDSSGQQVVRISFSQVGMPASWQLDDLLLDPWRSI